jgi:hypothetical protein
MDWLCDTAGFLTRSQCGAGWAAWLKQTYQLANFLIWFAYLVMALGLYNVYRCKKTELPANKKLTNEMMQTIRMKHELIQEVELLKERNRALEHMLKMNAWINEKNGVIEQLSRELSGNHSDREMT